MTKREHTSGRWRGPWHLISPVTGESLESYYSEEKARHWCYLNNQADVKQGYPPDWKVCHESEVTGYVY